MKQYRKSIYIVIATIVAVFVSVALLYRWPVALGTLAAWVTTGSFSLQVIHMIRQKDTKGVSLGMYTALFFGVTSWTFYGYKMNDVPVMTANGLTALLAITVIVLKLYNERPSVKKPKPQAKVKAKTTTAIRQQQIG
ncbi:SemiSWEET family sugar transporter [Acinetobacter boissieri]|uniref:MtN3 and saliva related transmembrane protein n=1 Tax=Acinetobacter boissieri TaxID=1219383 RepID=A0A1G6GSV2_9GAMM|nr:SemiSWEET family transporter [Acinetobacter boissieri]SDB85077.1 MtN3 and saliva related transmembrane protein [Acinetobacter boissieri]